MPTPKPLPQLELLSEYLHYFPETGDFVWVNTTSFRVKQGDVAGTVATNDRQRTKPHQHLLIRFQGVKYLAHRLAWLFGHGVFSTAELAAAAYQEAASSRLSLIAT
jgi:hypothetical protein